MNENCDVYVAIDRAGYIHVSRIHVSSRGIAGFTEQRTAFTRAQSAILQGQDFNLRVERALKIAYPRS